MTDLHYSDQLSAYLDGELDGAARARIEAHLGACAACRVVLEDLRALVAAAPDYAGTPPERDLWPLIAARLDEPTVVPLPLERSAPRLAPAGAGRRTFRMSLPALLAASIAMASLGAGAAWLALRTGGPAPAPLASAPDGPAAGTPDDSLAVATVGIAAARYDAAVADLESVVAEGRTRLDTATVRVIDESLRRIDAAIADARAAIQRDPANAYLTRQIAANMRRKLNLLRTAAKAIAES